MDQSTIHFVECPRDAMQGWPHMISTQQKIDYLNCLLQVGFDTIDFGSFVSPKAIPQMADTKNVIPHLQLQEGKTKLLAIVANQRGAEEAVVFDEISYLGFPLSISETFQQRNTNSSIAESLERVETIQELCIKNKKQLVVYLSMAFGNPYDDPYDAAILLQYAQEMLDREVKIISLADTVGVATPEQIAFALNTLVPQHPKVHFGVHLHSRPEGAQEKVDAALQAGCKRFDGAINGIGGCPMAKDELVGNMNTNWLLPYLQEKGLAGAVHATAWKQALQMANEVFVG